MQPRYTVRGEPNRRYLVWDNERNQVATSSEKDEHVYSSLDDALNAADDLNRPTKPARDRPTKPARNRPTKPARKTVARAKDSAQHGAAQQQQQPQPDKEE
jgi:hypothetical protein